MHRVNTLLRDSFFERLFMFIYFKIGHVELPFLKNQLAIITIAYNNSEMIRYQIKLLKKYITDSFDYYVFDNSNKKKVAKKIQHLCEDDGIRYHRMVPNCLSYKGGSFSHALGLQWAYSRLCLYYEYLCFIDHDIFPIQAFSILEKLKSQPFYGLKQERDMQWYLWPGFSFYAISMLQNKLNFFPQQGLDTGGGNWHSIFCRYKQEKLRFAMHSYADIHELLDKNPSEWKFMDGHKLDTGALVKEDFLVEMIDAWLHVFNGSNWRNTADKMNYVSQILDKLI